MNFQELYDTAKEHDITDEDLELANLYCENCLEEDSATFALLHIFQMGKIAGIRQERRRRKHAR
ncbi:hypothetical protein AB1I63_06000 [Streptococcus pneumoniae]